jgi:hypothetical protein
MQCGRYTFIPNSREIGTAARVLLAAGPAPGKLADVSRLRDELVAVAAGGRRQRPDLDAVAAPQRGALTAAEAELYVELPVALLVGGDAGGRSWRGRASALCRRRRRR